MLRGGLHRRRRGHLPHGGGSAGAPLAAGDPRRSAGSSGPSTCPVGSRSRSSPPLFALGSVSGTVQNVLGVVAFISFGTVPLFFLAGLLRTRLYRAAARLLREVPDEPTPAEIQAGLRRVLGDPTLRLPDLDRRGRLLRRRRGQPLRADPGRPETRGHARSTYEGIKLGAIVHDEALHHQQALIDEVVSAARLAMMKDRGLQALRLSEARSRALLDAIPDLMFRMARDGTYLEAAGRRESLIRPREELIGRSVGELLPRDVADRFEVGALAAGSVGVQTIEYRLDDRRRGSRLRGAHRACGQRRDDGDRPRLHRADAARGRALAPSRDVQREQAFTRAVVDVAPVIFLLDRHRGPDRPIQRERRGALRLRRRRAGARQALVGRVPPGGEPRGRAGLLPPMNEGAEQLHGEADWIAADGRRSSCSADRPPRGRRRWRPPLPDLRPGFDGACRGSATRSRRSATSSRRSAARRRACSSPSSATARSSPEGVNYAFRELMGYGDEDAIGTRFWDLVAPPELVAEVQEAFEEQVESGVGIEHETAWIGRTGNVADHPWWLRPLGEVERQVRRLRHRHDRAQGAGGGAARVARRGSSRPATTSAGGSSETCTTARSSGSCRSRSRSGSRRRGCGTTRTAPTRSSPAPARSSRTRSPSCASSPAASIRPSSPTAGSPPRSRRSPTRAPLPVELTADLDERLPGPVEAAAYYVVAEALTNVAKYAEASAVEVRAQRQNGRVVVEVADNGVGGADPLLGSGTARPRRPGRGAQRRARGRERYRDRDNRARRHPALARKVGRWRSSSRPARSRCSAPTSKARPRSSDGWRRVRARARAAPAISCALRRGARRDARSTAAATRCCSSSPTRGRGRGGRGRAARPRPARVARRARGARAHGHPHGRAIASRARATSGSTCTAPRGSAAPATAARCCSRSDTTALAGVETRGSRCAAAARPARARAGVPARRGGATRGLPAAPRDAGGGRPSLRERRMRVVVAEDSVLLREGIARLLEDAGIEIVGQAGNARRADAEGPLATSPTSRSWTSACRRRRPTRGSARRRRSARSTPRPACSCSPSTSSPRMRSSCCPRARRASATC